MEVKRKNNNKKVAAGVLAATFFFTTATGTYFVATNTMAESLPFEVKTELDQLIQTNASENESKEQIKKEQKENNILKLDYTTSDYTDMLRPTVDEVFEAQENILTKKDIITADLEIPAIGLQTYILPYSNENMLYGANTYLQDSVIGEGNYVLAGHNIGKRGVLFSDLSKVKEGNDVYLNNGSKTFHYQITSKSVTDYKDTSSLLFTEKPTITLITCDSPYETPSRVIVKGKLKEVTNNG